MSRELLEKVVQVYEKYKLDRYIHEDDEYLFDEIKQILKIPAHAPLSDNEIDGLYDECLELEEYYDYANGDSKRWVLKDEYKFARTIERYLSDRS